MVVDDACEVQCGLNMMRSRSRQGARKISFKRLKRRAWRLSSAICLGDIFLDFMKTQAARFRLFTGGLSSPKIIRRPRIHLDPIFPLLHQENYSLATGGPA